MWGVAYSGGSLLAGFLERVMRRLLLEDVGRDVVELAADALLPLIAAHPAAFQSLGACPRRRRYMACMQAPACMPCARMHARRSLHACADPGPRGWLHVLAHACSHHALMLDFMLKRRPGRCLTAGMHGAGEGLLASQQSAEARQALVDAVNKLLVLDKGGHVMDRLNRRQFRGNLSDFVVNARGVVRLR